MYVQLFARSLEYLGGWMDDGLVFGKGIGLLAWEYHSLGFIGNKLSLVSRVLLMPFSLRGYESS